MLEFFWFFLWHIFCCSLGENSMKRRFCVEWQQKDEKQENMGIIILISSLYSIHIFNLSSIQLMNFLRNNYPWNRITDILNRQTHECKELKCIFNLDIVQEFSIECRGYLSIFRRSSICVQLLSSDPVARWTDKQHTHTHNIYIIMIVSKCCAHCTHLRNCSLFFALCLLLHVLLPSSSHFHVNR